MFLDLNQRDQAAALAPQPNEGTTLPPTFGDAFNAAWSEGHLFSQSVAGENARAAALQDYLDEIKAKSGKDITPQLEWGSDVSGVGYVANPASTMLDQANEHVGKLQADGAPVAPLSQDDLEQRAVAKSRAAVSDYNRIQNYFEQYDQDMKIGANGGAFFNADTHANFFAKVGMALGGFAAAATDPINIAAIPVAPAAELGVLASALRWGVIGAGAQAGIEFAGAPFHEAAQPGYGESGAPVANILEAGAGGMVLGGATKALGNLWSRVKTGAWPTSVRDAGNVVESEAHTANSNLLPGVEGEVAHHEAVVKSIDDVVAGKPVDVSDHITPEMTDGVNAKLAFAEHEGERLPPEMEALSERQLSEFQATGDIEGLGKAITKLARNGYDVELAPHEADTMAERIMSAPDDHTAQQQIQGVTQAMIEARLKLKAEQPAPAVAEVAPVPQINATGAIGELLKSPQMGMALRSDLDRARMNGDVQVPMGVDENGKPITQSLDSILDDIDAYRKAAAHLEDCVNPSAGADI